MKARGKKEAARWYVRLPLYIASCRDLTTGEKVLLCIILDHIGEHGFGWPGLTTLAARTGTTRQAVHRTIIGLKRRKYLIVESGGRGKSNQYRPGLALLELERSWRARAVKNERRIRLRQGVSATLTGCKRHADKCKRHADSECKRHADSAVSATLTQRISVERTPLLNADQEQNQGREGAKKRIPSPDAAHLSARPQLRLPQQRLPEKPRRSLQAVSMNGTAWVLRIIRQQLGSRFSTQGQNLQQDVKRLAKRCRGLAGETGETRRGVLKRVCREARHALDNGSWKPPVFIGNLLKDSLWKPLEPGAAPRAHAPTRQDGCLSGAFPGYGALARRAVLGLGDDRTEPFHDEPFSCGDRD